MNNALNIIRPRSANERAEVRRYPQKSVLIVDDRRDVRNFLFEGLKERFGLVELAENFDKAEALRQRCHFDLIITDSNLSGRSGIEWVARMRERGGTTTVIFVADHADLETAVAALRAGAADFIMKPLDMDRMLASIERCMGRQQVQQDGAALRRDLGASVDSGIVGESTSIRSLLALLQRIAPTPTTVLIEGESGTGKELAARALHRWSGRGGSFVAINCGAITEDLMESELFGHVKGSFTGANQTREGLFNYASGGTVFLDEIGEMPLSMQVHLLRVLEEKTIRQVGANRETPVDVRVIAATNRDLRQLVENGGFREDLFYRLNVVSVLMPPLRERFEDLPMLVEHFARSIAFEMGMPRTELRLDQIAALRRHHWPGNVRELRNVIERCLLLNMSPEHCLAPADGDGEGEQAGEQPGEALQAGSDRLEDVVRRHILRVLERENGNKSAAARVLGVSRKTLERKVKEWQA